MASLIGGIVWIAPWTNKAPTSVSLQASSPSSSAQHTPDPPKKPTPTARKSTHKPTKKATPTATTPKTTAPKTTAPPTPTAARTTKRSTPTPVRSTKKPVANAKFSILEFQLSGGPGQSNAQGCYMPPIHFQTYVESTRQEIWFNSAWSVDGKVISSNRTWVSKGEFTAFVTSGQYMLKPGPHKLTLRVTSPSTASKTISFTMCAMETW
ncbi:hypothetical protein ABZ897_09235 [Nonomuraea sp. NPDC046802]|uniref:hypothetical protein n=1 Tax=Nonomuraea sp. NPDC046802 TaxID=3154919 RepID=UPI0033D9F2EB